MQELVRELNNLKITQTSSEWEEDIPVDIWSQHLKNGEDVDSGLDVDKRRWYETSITVYQIGEKFLGVRSVTDLFSEQMSVSDVGYTLEFFEMEAITITSYRQK